MDNKPVDHLSELALHIVPFFLKHNAEADAVDLLLELEAIDKIPEFIDKNTYKRVCLYMMKWESNISIWGPSKTVFFYYLISMAIVSCVNYLPPPEDKQFLKTVRRIYKEQGRLSEALQVAIKIGDWEFVEEDFNACTDPWVWDFPPLLSQYR